MIWFCSTTDFPHHFIFNLISICFYQNFIRKSCTFFVAEDRSGCPVGSQTLINQWNQIQGCDPGICPQMYSCYYTIQYNRYQCCSSLSASVQVSFGIAADTAESTECEPGLSRIKGRCMRCNHYRLFSLPIELIYSVFDPFFVNFNM